MKFFISMFVNFLKQYKFFPPKKYKTTHAISGKHTQPL